MSDEELDKWWVHLRVDTKETITGLPYPACTEQWNKFSREVKEELYNISGGRDAHDHHKWKKGNGSFT